MKPAEIIDKLKQNNLRVTPQRVAIFEAVCALNNHPTAENIIGYLQKKHPYISTGTVYKVLETLVASKLLIKVKTEKGILRYDPVLTTHHHLYCIETDRIEDYLDDELNGMINAYFENKKIKNFQIREIKLQITGNFKTN